MGREKSYSERMRLPHALHSLFLQYIKIVPLVAFVIILLLLVLTPFVRMNDLLRTGIIVITIYGTMVYVALHSGQWIEIDAAGEYLRFRKKAGSSIEIPVCEIKEIVSKSIKTNPGFKYSLIVEKSRGESVVLYDESTFYLSGNRTVDDFSRKTGLPVRHEYWVEDFNGKLVQIEEAESTSRKRSAYWILGVPFGISFLGAVVYRMNAGFSNFILIGVVTILVNTGITAIYTVSKRRELGDWASSNITLIAVIISAIVSFVLAYLIFVFIVTDHNLLGEI